VPTLMRDEKRGRQGASWISTVDITAGLRNARKNPAKHAVTHCGNRAVESRTICPGAPRNAP